MTVQQQLTPKENPGHHLLGSQKLNWAEITKLKRPKAAKFIPSPLQAKINKTKSLLTKGSFVPCHEPKPPALYFKIVKRGPLVEIRNALRECLPNWALLGLDFVGSSVMEIITDRQLKDKIVGTLKQLGMVNVPNLSIFESAVRSRKEEESLEDRSERNFKYGYTPTYEECGESEEYRGQQRVQRPPRRG